MTYQKDDRDEVDLTNVPQHLQGLHILQHKSRWRLAEALQGKGVDTPPDHLFINSVNDPDEGLVIHHVSLVEAVTDALQNSEPPSYSERHSGVFTVRGSFEKNHRADAGDLDLDGFVHILGDVYMQLA
ncbi:hypothetical protein PS627_02774 [Pseudomonas fluorescens]|uniref:hypothetical protein n=1 Tax=Pseudomonas fluorescens TaxID=294 RepID=UPI001259252A|nr:hypothetical protein [Pseudomonas fluorescens]CAG8868013.1 hypothetical protein PS627_02774 [Pseudomonas fluorescens]VVP97223.1 hypothetical protein PS910_03456 [Pseudomonas fluorescens]